MQRIWNNWYLNQLLSDPEFHWSKKEHELLEKLTQYKKEYLSSVLCIEIDLL